MGEDFEDSVDTSSFGDITDTTETNDTSSFSDPVDVGGMLDDVPVDPIESFDVEPIDSSFETDLPAAETSNMDSLTDVAVDTYTAEEVSSDMPDPSVLDPSDDISSEIDDEIGTSPDIADLLDEAAIDEVSLDSGGGNETHEDNIEALMTDVEAVPDADEYLSTIETGTLDGGEETEIDVEAMLNTEEIPSAKASDLTDYVPSDITEDSSEQFDASNLMDETDINESVSFADASLENLSMTGEIEEVPPIEANIENDVVADEAAEIHGPQDAIADETDSESDDISEDLQDAQEEMEMSLGINGTPLDAELSAYDQLADYFNSHNYGQQDYDEYSKDPEWQELNNAYLQELGQEPVDYSSGDAPDINDIRDELIAAGIPEGSPELDAILANEQAGIDMANSSETDGNIIKEDMSDLPADESLEQSEPDVYKASPISEIPIIQEDGTVDTLENIMDRVEQDIPSTEPDLEPNEAIQHSDIPVVQEDEIVDPIEKLTNQDDHETDDGSYDSVPETLSEDQSRIDGLNADKEELLALKEQLLEYQQEHTEETDQDDGAIVKVLKKDGSDTSVAHHDYDAEFEDLDKGIKETDVPKLDDVSDWINDINPNYDPFDFQSPYSNNCGSCAFAVEQRLDGNTDILATSENVGTIDEMNRITGMEQVSMSPDEIKDYLVSQGPGSHGIVGIDRVSGPGHWFNAYYDGEKVVAIDGQTGEISDWPPDYGDVTNWDISVRKEEK